MYLTEETADHMLAEVTRAPAHGGRLLVEHLDTRMMREGGRAVQDAVKAQNSVLISARDDIADWLAGHGWQAIVHAGSDPEIG
jgi:O-methyltransferase involved in polyketide biosynthesis